VFAHRQLIQFIGFAGTAISSKAPQTLPMPQACWLSLALFGNRNCCVAAYSGNFCAQFFSKLNNDLWFTGIILCYVKNSNRLIGKHASSIIF
jgi:hypothetical protein